MLRRPGLCPLFFFNDTATTEIYTLSLHDALPISRSNGILKTNNSSATTKPTVCFPSPNVRHGVKQTDRKSTRLNSSHLVISYAVFCLKKKKIDNTGQLRGSTTQGSKVQLVSVRSA